MYIYVQGLVLQALSKYRSPSVIRYTKMSQIYFFIFYNDNVSSKKFNEPKKMNTRTNKYGNKLKLCCVKYKYKNKIRFSD